MADNDFDFGFSFEETDLSKQPETPSVDGVLQLVEQHKELITADARAKLQQVEQLILPLLYNLQKNPEKEYIHWPNRKDIIQKQIDKILQVTRHYEK